jgi:hypothetical protein
MRISRFSRRFHDPWGNKYGNRCGSPIRFQFQVSKQGSRYDEDGGSLDDNRYYVDKTVSIESVGNRFVKATKRSMERLRR